MPVLTYAYPDFQAYTKIISAQVNSKFTAIATVLNGTNVLPRNILATGGVNQVVYNDASGNLTSEAQLAISRGGTGATGFTTNGVVLGGASSLSSTGAGTSNQALLIPNGGGTPAFAQITSANIGSGAAGNGTVLMADGLGNTSFQSSGSVGPSAIYLYNNFG